MLHVDFVRWQIVAAFAEIYFVGDGLNYENYDHVMLYVYPYNSIVFYNFLPFTVFDMTPLALVYIFWTVFFGHGERDNK